MEKQVAGAEITINAPVETVWHAITNSKIALMPGTTVESDWEVGDPITFEGEFNGKVFKDYGEITEKDDWSGFADLFTEDATYEEHALGTFEGREAMGLKVIANIRSWSDGHRPPDQVLEGWL